MNILHVSMFDAIGGAGRSANRLHSALRECKVDSRMRVLRKECADPLTISGASLQKRLMMQIQNKFDQLNLSRFSKHETTYYSLGNVSAGLVEELNQSKADLLHLHWVTGMLSIEDIGRIKKPIVWTMHDKWALGGADHLSGDELKFNHSSILVENSPLERLHIKVYERKVKSWDAGAFTLICPSLWMEKAARQSKLFAKSKIVCIPNAIAANSFWKPRSKPGSRKELNLPLDKKIIFFGAYGGGHDPNKGLDLLIKSLQRHKALYPMEELEIIICADVSSSEYLANECPYMIHWLGNIASDEKMRDLYSASDLVALPSRIENFPNSALEAHCCEVPVIAFDVGGIENIVQHKQTGWLAPPFDIESFANGIYWALSDPGRLRGLGDRARYFAKSNFDNEIIAKKHIELYQEIISHKP